MFLSFEKFSGNFFSLLRSRAKRDGNSKNRDISCNRKAYICLYNSATRYLISVTKHILGKSFRDIPSPFSLPFFYSRDRFLLNLLLDLLDFLASPLYSNHLINFKSISISRYTASYIKILDIFLQFLSVDSSVFFHQRHGQKVGV